MNCIIVFVLDDGTRFIGDKQIKENLKFFPDGILDTMKPIFFKTLFATDNWNKSVITVYQNGKHDIELNIPPDVPFSLDDIF